SAFSGRTPHNFLLNIIAVMWNPHNRYYGLCLHNVWYRGTIEFRWFKMRGPKGGLHAGQVKAYIQFCLALGAKAINNRAASSRKRTFNPISSKYDFRVFLLSLGLVGPDFATARHHLLANLEGDSAFKNGRPQTEQAA
ncbi:MAG TPA: amidoligase family protein, partial [bacterium]|nr:amidoligase family protein [bacterium]